MQLDGKKILLVEDDPDLIEGLSTALQQAGALVRVKSSVRGPETAALSELQKNSSAYDLAILDIRLPVDDEKLRESHELIREYNSLASQVRGCIASGDLLMEDDLRDKCVSIRDRYLESIDNDAARKMLEELRSIGATINTPVLFLTSRSDPRVRNEVVEIARELCDPHGVDLLVKPVLIEALLSKMAVLFRPRGEDRNADWN